MFLATSVLFKNAFKKKYKDCEYISVKNVPHVDFSF